MRFMRDGTFARCLAMVIAAGGLVYSQVTAQAQVPASMPFDSAVTISGGEAVCTGVSMEAREDSRWNAYPLKVEIAGKGGQYLGDVQVTVSKDGAEVAKVTCGGPWLLFKLPPGRYQVDATIEGSTASSSAYSLAEGQGRIILRFPEMGGAMDKEAASGSEENIAAGQNPNWERGARLRQ